MQRERESGWGWGWKREFRPPFHWKEHHVRKNTVSKEIQVAVLQFHCYVILEKLLHLSGLVSLVKKWYEFLSSLSRKWLNGVMYMKTFKVPNKCKLYTFHLHLLRRGFRMRRKGSLGYYMDVWRSEYVCGNNCNGHLCEERYCTFQSKQNETYWVGTPKVVIWPAVLVIYILYL